MNPLCEAFRAADLALHPKLEEMLEEHSSHRTERRGCGYTQATRFLAARINEARDPVSAGDLDLFARWPALQTEAIARRALGRGWRGGWRNLHRAPESIIERLGDEATLAALRRLGDAIEGIARANTLPEHDLLIAMIEGILGLRAPEGAVLPPMPEAPKIGSCSQAEEFFLEIAHAKIRRGGCVNLIEDAEGVPCMIEKMHLGESHSAIVIRPVSLNGVTIAPGGLCALAHPIECDPSVRPGRVGHVPLEGLTGVRFLRLTTLSVAPRDRRRAFSAQIDAQLRMTMVSPLSTTIEHVRDFALAQGRNAA